MKGMTRIGMVGGVALAMVLASQSAYALEELPAGVRGFSGQVRGLVKSKGEKNTFSFLAARMIRVWPGNKAEKPEALAGRTIRIGPAIRVHRRCRSGPHCTSSGLVSPDA